MNELHHHILQIVDLIPKGKVATYGQIANLAGLPKHARLVGYVLKNLAEDTQIPWHRVINSQGHFSILGDNGKGVNRCSQATKLQLEDVEVNNGKVSLRKFQWCP